MRLTCGNCGGSDLVRARLTVIRNQAVEGVGVAGRSAQQRAVGYTRDK